MGKQNKTLLLIVAVMIMLFSAIYYLTQEQRKFSYGYLSAAMVDSLSILAAPSMERGGMKPTSFLTGKDTAQALIGGSVDLATMAEWPFLLALKNRKDLRVVGIISVAANLGILVSSSSSLQSMREMEGKKIALPVGTTPQFLVENYLSQAGVDLAKIKIVNLPPPQLQSALTRGDVDGIAIWQPFLERARQIKPNAYKYLPNSQQFVKTHYVVAGTAKTVASRREIVRATLQHLIEAEKVLGRGDQKVVRELANAMGLKEETFSDLLPLFEFKVSMDERIIEAWKRVAPWALKRGYIDADIAALNWYELIDATILRELDASRVKF